MSIKIALVGCGRIAKRHAELLGFGQVKGATLVAVCDIAESKAKAFGKQFNVPSYPDMDEMVIREQPDVVVVLTPSGMHAEHVIRLARHGKHIVVEKPMALKLEDADAMIEASRNNNIRLFVVKQNRFNVPVVKLKEAIDQGRFGRLIMGTVRVRWCRPQAYYDQDAWRGTWRYDGGVLTNQASHHIDLLEWMMGEVETVYAKGMTALADIETEDTAIAVLKFRNGALGTIEATTATRPKDIEGSISILGEKGTVEIGGFAVNAMRVWQFGEPHVGDEDIMEKYSVNPPNVYGFGHHAYYDHVVDCIVNDKRALVDGEEGRRSLALLVGMYESIETASEMQLPTKANKCRLGLGC